jgi:hypothetical protein
MIKAPILYDNMLSYLVLILWIVFFMGCFETGKHHFQRWNRGLPTQFDLIERAEPNHSHRLVFFFFLPAGDSALKCYVLVFRIPDEGQGSGC